MTEAVGSNTSVFSSGFNHDYLQLLNSDPEIKLKYKPMGTSNSILSGRISWFFDFKAASLTIDTACSSSMVAFHLAAQNLRNNEADMTLVCGVNVFTWPTDWFNMDHHGFFAGEGKSFSFDHRASGYSRGEGVATVIMKRLSTALRDGDTIRAVVRGTGLNQDGRTPGITLPSAPAQEQMIKDVYERGGVNIDETGYIEAHATGTAAGDPIEARAIANSFKTWERKVPLVVGAVKSAIGHTEGASGLAGIIKSVMILESGVIPPNTNFEKANPKIPIDKWKLRLPLEPIPWPLPGMRQVSINSFGFSGTNGHVVMQDALNYLEKNGLQGFHKTKRESNLSAITDGHSNGQTNDVNKPLVAALQKTVDGPIDSLANGNGDNTSVSSDTGCINTPTESVELAEPNGANGHTQESALTDTATTDTGNAVPIVFPFSSFDEAGVQRNVEALATFYAGNHRPSAAEADRNYLQALSHTLEKKRTLHPWRSFVLAKTFDELVQNLSMNAFPKPVRTRGAPNIGFVFTGQGAQWFAMGRELLVYPVFKQSLEEATKHMQELGGSWSLLEELQKDKENSRIDKPFLAHPACTALQVALVDLLTSWNLRPSRVVGHSSGEIAAAYCANKITTQTAWKVAFFRGLVSSQIVTPGAMMAVGLPESDIKPYLDNANALGRGKAIVACYNSPKNHTISGDEAVIDALKEALDVANVFCRKLKVKTAYHSAHMKTVAEEYLQLLGQMDKPADIAASLASEMYSSVTGERHSEDITAQYWVDNLVSPVRFSDALLKMSTERAASKGLKVSSGGSSGAMIQDIVEVGPHSALRSAIKDTLSSSSAADFGYHPVLDRIAPGLDVILSAMGELQSRGSFVDLGLVNRTSSDDTSSKPPSMLVNLPPYDFNHSQKIWTESRLSRNYRFREHPKHDLFGARVPDWNPEEPVWRNYVRISEQPWLRDHVVTGSIVYPGVGYIIMAIEASKQIADPELTLTGFHLKDLSIKSALIVPDNKEGIEVKFCMSPMDESAQASSKTWRQWRVLSYNPTGDNWVTHCTGYIETQYETPAGPIDGGLEAEAEKEASKKMLYDGIERCTSGTSINYDNLDSIGLHFGPLFQNLSQVKVNKGKGEVVADITLPDVRSVMPQNFAHEHMIHPSSMDSMCHLFIAAVLDITDKSSLGSPMVPVEIKSVKMNAKLVSTAGYKYRGIGSSRQTGFQKFHSDITIWDGQSDEEMIAIRGWNTKSLGSEIEATDAAKKLCHSVEWKPDLELVKYPRKLNEIALASDEANQEERELFQRLQLASTLFVTAALEELKDATRDDFEGHFAKYHDWCIKVRDDLNANVLPHLEFSEWQRYATDETLRKTLYERLEKDNADGRLLVRMGTNLAAVMRKEVDPLQLMFGQDKILDELYSNMVHSGNLPILLKAYLEIAHHNKTNIRILEIGAGTGSLTQPVLESLSPPSQDKSSNDSAIAKYTYTDISSGFFEKAKEKFSTWKNILEFRTFNIENEAGAQGFELGTYDYIFAGNVIHATADLKLVLSNLRTLLKPSGQLVLHEGIRQDLLWLPLSFGQLNGWWLSIEPNRKFCPSISEKEWDEVLQQAGFSGIETTLFDREVEDIHGQSIMFAGNKKEIGTQAKERQVFVISSSSTDALATALRGRIVGELGMENCSVVSLSELADKQLIEATCISVVDLDTSNPPVLANLNPENYKHLNHILATSDGVFWVSRDIEKHPEHHMISGLVRTVRWERDLDAPNLVTLSVAEPQPTENELVEQLISVFKHQYVDDIAVESKNAEYILRGGEVLASRLIDANDINSFIASHFMDSDPKMAPLESAGRPIMLDTSSPGSLSALHFATDPVYARPLADNEVEVEIKAVGLNFRDVLIAMGEHVAACLGNEAAGYVSRIGSQVTNVQVGDRVLYMNGLVDGGCLKTYGRQSCDAVVKLPDNVSFEDAAGLPCVYSTAIHGLYDIAHLEKGETLLIHAAAGGVGQAAIQLAQLVGGEIFATVSSAQKRDLLIEEFGIQKDHIFSSRDLSFAKGIMRMTNNKGVDVVLNSLAGDLLRASWDILAPFGRFIEIGKRDAQANGRIDLNPLLRQTVMASVDLTTIMYYKPKKLGQLISETVRLFSEGKVRIASPTKVMDYTQIEEAFRSLQSGKSMGKVVFKPNPHDIVPIMPDRPLPLKFDENASYFSAGGLGGLGRSIARWMVSRGAKNLIFASRSGKKSETAQDLVKELEEAGCKTTVFACDVSDKEALSKVLQECKETLPPIKGCVQGSMVLKVCCLKWCWSEFQLANKFSSLFRIPCSRI